ncbi:hypothetical protein EYF80_033518 [Liparis tanakae]|uniref:Uncharacterized protein n=1 Tax=Liparis tanakae TaxID=230148 RepID=A0A4Z2GUC8_9TELE|nr:hypothetical protein EYF80_033518 [Liparis tanakae]
MFSEVDSTHTIHLPDHSPQQSRASFIVEAPDEIRAPGRRGSRAREGAPASVEEESRASASTAPLSLHTDRLRSSKAWEETGSRVCGEIKINT